MSSMPNPKETKARLQALQTMLQIQKEGPAAVVLREMNKLVDDFKDIPKGDKGDPGSTGERGPQGVSLPGPQGPAGPQGVPGRPGNYGPVGPKGTQGDKGLPGIDGSPDKPEDIKRKLESLKDEGRLDASAIKNLPQAIEKYSPPNIELGRGGAGGGGARMLVADEGVLVGQDIQILDFIGAGVTVTRVGNRAVISITGGGNSGTPADNETPDGLINSSNKVFTLLHTPNPAAGLKLYLNGGFLTQGVEYTLSGNTITFATAPDISFAGLPFKAFYTY